MKGPPDDATWLGEILSALLPDGARTVTLDEVGEALGTRVVGSAEVELLLTALEGAGATIVEPGGEGLPDLLRRVLVAAREIRLFGGTPSPTSIAERSGISVRAVRVALLYADVIKG